MKGGISMAAMLPVFLLGVFVGCIGATVILKVKQSIPSHAKFKLQEEQLENARNDIRMFEEELTKAKEEIAKLKARKPRVSKEKK